MKGKCKKSYPQLEGILKEGDVVEIEHQWKQGENVKYLGYRFRSSNGNYYSETEIRNSIGLISLDEIFSVVL